MQKYTLTDEHRAQMEPWAQTWIAHGMSTAAMTEEDRAITREAVIGLYRAANLEPPPENRIVFVPSPFVLRFAAGFAAAIWWLQKNRQTAPAISEDAAESIYEAVDDATSAATDIAARRATDDATGTATSMAIDEVVADATIAATYEATYIAARESIRRATRRATYGATYGATYDATYDATDASTYRATSRATSEAIKEATHRAVDDATYDATDAATSAATSMAIDEVVADAINAATSGSTRDATYDSTIEATRDTTDAATSAAINETTYDATYEATYEATSQATITATDAAASDAISEPVNAATETWYAGIGNMRALAHLILGEHHTMFGLQCAARAWNMWQGGNQWAAWAAFLSFFRHVVKLPIDYSKWQHWESAAIHSGPRIMHSDFCMISDRPETLTVDDQNRPHNATGPFCQWRDGTRLYCWHGVQIPAKYYERQHTAREILDEPNTEVRRAMIERYDALRHSGAFIEDVGAKVLDSSVQRVLSNGKWAEKTAVNELLTIDLPDDPEERMVYLRVTCPSTERKYLIRVPPDQRTVRGALAWTANVPEDEYNLIAES